MSKGWPPCFRALGATACLIKEADTLGSWTAASPSTKDYLLRTPDSCSSQSRVYIQVPIYPWSSNSQFLTALSYQMSSVLTVLISRWSPCQVLSAPYSHTHIETALLKMDNSGKLCCCYHHRGVPSQTSSPKLVTQYWAINPSTSPWMSKRQKVNIYTDSRCAIATVHIHRNMASDS